MSKITEKIVKRLDLMDNLEKYINKLDDLCINSKNYLNIKVINTIFMSKEYMMEALKYIKEVVDTD